MHRYTAIAIAMTTITAGCADVATPEELQHTRILAVRATPPGILAEQTSRIDVLAATEAGELVQPTARSVRIVGGFGAELLSQDESGWMLTAPSADQIAAARQAAGIEDEPWPIIIEVTVELDGKTLVADKLVLVDVATSNPEVVDIRLAGVPVQDEMVVSVGAEVEVSATAQPETAELSYAWASSVGELSLYRSQAASFATDASGDGTLLVVVRDGQGGVAWKAVPVRAASSP